jgi:DNA ligase 1
MGNSLLDATEGTRLPEPQRSRVELMSKRCATLLPRPMMWLLCAVAVFASAQEASVTAPPLLLGETARSDVDPGPYLVSEKLDGVRAYWDGQTLRFRSGNKVNAPTWFTARLPSQALDGELWLGRGRFEELSGVVRKEQPDDAQWQQVKYMVFELPDAEGTFARRYRALGELVDRVRWPQLQVVEQIKIADPNDLRRKLNQVVRGGGEGLMLHRADASYVTGRSDVLLKLKLAQDSEAKVIGHVPGKGKFKGMLGALEVETPEGKRFRIGTGFSDATRKNPPPIGATVTYRYLGLTKGGLPRFASFFRVRYEF